MKTLLKIPQKRGSALLIVLGFLSFMMISAVSFAIYMRIERQASSNYRHTITARHLLNASLCRAIDEIDSDLRNVQAQNGASYHQYKFPTNWVGRVRASAVEDDENTNQNVRVLSLEALSFIPGILVNDVRRYAAWRDKDSVAGTAADPGYMGAKWRSLSMPVRSLGDESGRTASADGQAVIGRYAYVCVNVSDMLNVNYCKTDVRDAETNRVTIGHLFGSDTDRTKFYGYANTDKRYETLQDFYACMKAHYGSSSVFTDGGLASPYHEWIGSSANDDKFKKTGNHVLMTDGIVKQEPRKSDCCNLRTVSPLSDPSVLANKNNDVTKLVLNSAFSTAWKAALNSLPGNNDPTIDYVAGMIADYMDKNGVPNMLNSPSVEMVPMVSQLLVPAFFAPTINSRDDLSDPNNPQHIYYLDLLPNGPDVARLDVGLTWPFKKAHSTLPSFTLDIVAYMKIIPVHKAEKSGDFQEQPSTGNGYYKFTGTAACPDFSGVTETDQSQRYKKVTVQLTTSGQTKFDIVHSKNGIISHSEWSQQFTLGQPLSVALIVFARVKQGSDFVDSVPQALPTPPPQNGDINGDEFFAVPKLFFQTVASAPVQKTMAIGVPFTYEWSSLEVPDPRFNWKAANWLKNSDVNAISENRINPSTLTLLGRDGRDADIFMTVSDAGVLQSPGELGFIVRPFKYDPIGTSVDFRTRTAVDPTVDDSDYMYRTVRLYDHGDPSVAQGALNRGRDRIFEHFTMQNPDGSLLGARVNPLSNIPNVLEAAIYNTPFDYYWTLQSDQTRNRFTDSDTVWSKSGWNELMTGWAASFGQAQQALNASWTNHLVNVYGDWNSFRWYSEDTARKEIFNTSISKELFEIDRKMLMSYSLDSFSDRQQLFLYILRAEATPPGLGTSAVTGGGKSLAGGRAVALVWRDPYPVKYKMNTDGQNDFSDSENYKCRTDSNYDNDYSSWSDFGSVGSPWRLYKYNGIKDTAVDRTSYLHDHKILFFKQLKD